MHAHTHRLTHKCVHQHSVLSSLVNHRHEAFQGFCLTLLLIIIIKINKKEAEGNPAMFQMTVCWSNSKTIGDDDHEFDDVDYVTAVFAEELEMAQLDSKQYLMKINSLEGQFCFFLSRMFKFCVAVEFSLQVFTLCFILIAVTCPLAFLMAWSADWFTDWFGFKQISRFTDFNSEVWISLILGCLVHMSDSYTLL